MRPASPVRLDAGPARRVLHPGRRRSGDRCRAARARRACMIRISGADLVLPDRIVTGSTLVLEGDRIAEILALPDKRGALPSEGGSFLPIEFDLTGCYVVPGFIDVHVH